MDYKEIAQLLIDNFQNDFPLESRPYFIMAEKIGTSEDMIMKALTKMKEDDLISRIGPIYKTNRVGKSFLAACSISEDLLVQAADFINSFNEINHNYIRENELNFWFVVTGPTEEVINNVCTEIENKFDVKVYKFKMVKPYKIDLSFNGKIDWSLV